VKLTIIIEDVLQPKLWRNTAGSTTRPDEGRLLPKHVGASV
jgi:hypothetical protein